MPAVARKQTPESHQNYRVVSDERAPTRARAPRGHRWHEAPPVKTGGRSIPARRQADANAAETVDLSDLLEHFTGENAARTSQQQKEVEERRVARKRARLRHRPFRMTILAGAMAGAPLTLLACLLWIKSSSLALSRQESDLKNKIVAARSESERTSEEIASVNASPQVEKWAKERGWRRANPYDFDDVSTANAAVHPTVPVQPEVENSDAS